MYRENKEFAQKVQTDAQILIEIPNKWVSTPTPYAFTPRDIKVRFGKVSGPLVHSTKIFMCYFTHEGKHLKVSRLTPAPGFEGINENSKALLDAYLPKVLAELIYHAGLMNVDSIVVESRIPNIANSFLDLHFKAGEKDGNYVGEYCFKRASA
jgi:hypothetical protein